MPVTLTSLLRKFDALAALRQETFAELIPGSDRLVQSAEDNFVHQSMIRPLEEELLRLAQIVAGMRAIREEQIKQKAEMLLVIHAIGDEAATSKLARSLADDIVKHL